MRFKPVEVVLLVLNSEAAAHCRAWLFHVFCLTQWRQRTDVLTNIRDRPVCVGRIIGILRCSCLQSGICYPPWTLPPSLFSLCLNCLSLHQSLLLLAQSWRSEACDRCSNRSRISSDNREFSQMKRLWWRRLTRLWSLVNDRNKGNRRENNRDNVHLLVALGVFYDHRTLRAFKDWFKYDRTGSV